MSEKCNGNYDTTSEIHAVYSFASLQFIYLTQTDIMGSLKSQVTWKSWLRKTVHFLPTREDRNIKWNWQETVSKPKEQCLHSDGGCHEWQIFTWDKKNNWISSRKRTTGGWYYFSLRSLSNKSLNLHNTFWKVSLLASSSLTVFTKYLLLGQGRKEKRSLLNGPLTCN